MRGERRFGIRRRFDIPGEEERDVESEARRLVNGFGEEWEGGW